MESTFVTAMIYVGVVGAGLLALAVFTLLVDGVTTLINFFRK